MKYFSREYIKENNIILIACVILLFIGFVVYAAAGPRMHDQYWYLGDVESLINGLGVQTNNIFPIEAIKGKILTNPPFVHNTPLIWIAALPALLFGAYNGWIITNIVASLTAALLIYKSSRVYASKNISMIFSLLYLLLPLTIWQSSQLLVEALISPFVALMVYLFVAKRERFSSWVLMALTALFLAICKSSFIPLLFVVPIAYFIDNKKTLKLFVKATLLLIVSALLFSLVSPIFKDNAAQKNPSIKDYLGVINLGVPGKSSNMDYYFNLNQGEFNYSELLENFKIKAVHGLKVQFFNLRIMGVSSYLPFNLMILCLFYLLYIYSKEKKKKYLRLVLLGFLFFSLHLSTICLMQNQFRYMLMVLPAIIVPTAIACDYGYKQSEEQKNNNTKILKLIMCIFIAIFLVVDFSISSSLREFSIEERERKENFKGSVVNIVKENESILLQGTTNYAMMAYALEPRQVLFVYDNYSKKDYETLISSIDTKWVLSKDDSQIIDFLGIEGNERYRLDSPFSEFLLIKLKKE